MDVDIKLFPSFARGTKRAIRKLLKIFHVLPFFRQVLSCSLIAFLACSDHSLAKGLTLDHMKKEDDLC